MLASHVHFPHLIADCVSEKRLGRGHQTRVSIAVGKPQPDHQSPLPLYTCHPEQKGRYRWQVLVWVSEVYLYLALLMWSWNLQENRRRMACYWVYGKSMSAKNLTLSLGPASVDPDFKCIFGLQFLRYPNNCINWTKKRWKGSTETISLWHFIKCATTEDFFQQKTKGISIVGGHHSLGATFLVVRDIDCGDWLAQGYMPAHQHCELFYPPAEDLIGSALN